MSGEDIDWQEIHKRLSARGAFKVKTYTQESRNGKKMTFSYIDARDVMDRLDEVVGPENWEDDYELLDAENCVVKCRLTIHGTTKAGIGYPNNPGSDKEAEPAKAAESDSLKRAAVKWGIGRFLYQGGEPKQSAPENALRPEEPVNTAPATQFQKASPHGPASANQLATINKLSRLLGNPEEPSADMTSAEASERITELSREYNERTGAVSRARTPPLAPEQDRESLVTTIRNLAADIEEQTGTPRKDLADMWSPALKTNRAWHSEDEANLRRIFEWCQVYLTKNKKTAANRQQGAHA